METPSFFVVERYLVARMIWKRKNERAHDGFAATGSRAAVPAQTYGEWFQWAYGMTLDEYGKLAEAGKHAELVKTLPNVLVDYKIQGRWLTAIAAPGETYEGCCASMQRMFPQIEEMRPHT